MQDPADNTVYKCLCPSGYKGSTGDSSCTAISTFFSLSDCSVSEIVETMRLRGFFSLPQVFGTDKFRYSDELIESYTLSLYNSK